MLTTVLQIAGFVLGFLFLIIEVVIHPNPLTIMGLCAMSVHFVGDWVAGFLKPPLVIWKFNISDMIQGPQFTQHVGMWLAVAGTMLVLTGRHDIGLIVWFFGAALAQTGFVWANIYK